ncbi:MAG: UDP-3-O-(3-hydroxymyristoyl)glucosamine N-acyltransferase [Pseudomonadales bacterium]
MQDLAYTLGELASRLSARLVGDADIRITGLGSLATAQPGQITHLSSPAYRAQLADTRASAVILGESDLERWPGAALVVARPYLAFARVSQLFERAPELAAGVDAGAYVDPTAELGREVRIGAGVVVGARTRIGDGAWLHPNCVVAEDCEVGAGARLMAGAVLYPRVRLGARCIVHGGAVIGADGFGFTPDERGHLEAIAQLVGVRIGDDVSIGACTSIDRGAIDDTVIEDGVKIDNQVQIGHNCRIGAHSVICGCVGIVGSTRIGRHCVLAGGVGVGGDGPIELCDGVVVSGMTHVSSSITEPGTYSGGVLHAANGTWKRNAIRFNRLDELSRRVARLERALAGKEAGDERTA